MNTDNYIIHIALAANHRYLPGLRATITSILLSCKSKDRLMFHVFAEGLSSEDCEVVRATAGKFGVVQNIDFVHPDMEPIKKLFKPYKGSHAAFLRLYLCEFLQDVDWIVYADVDILWFRDVCELWDERNDDVSVLWSKDLPSIREGAGRNPYWGHLVDESRYACSGVMLMNLKKMRETDFVHKCSDFVAKFGTPGFVDQDIMNCVCRDDSKLLDQRWDCMMPDIKAPKGVVLHFNGIGSLFNGPYESWLPHYNIWFAFYFAKILGQRFELQFKKRLVFFLASLIFPYRPIIKFFVWPFGLHRVDNIQRTLFFAWLRRKLKKVV